MKRLIAAVFCLTALSVNAAPPVNGFCKVTICAVHTTPITFVDQFTISYVPPVHRYVYDYSSSTDADIVIPQWHTEGKITKLAFNIDGVDYIPEGYF